MTGYRIHIILFNGSADETIDIIFEFFFFLFKTIYLRIHNRRDTNIKYERVPVSVADERGRKRQCASRHGVAAAAAAAAAWDKLTADELHVYLLI